MKKINSIIKSDQLDFLLIIISIIINSILGLYIPRLAEFATYPLIISSIAIIKITQIQLLVASFSILCITFIVEVIDVELLTKAGYEILLLMLISIIFKSIYNEIKNTILS